jgi:hypothetical protein
LWQKQYEQPILSIDWSINNLIAFSHGPTLEVMVWKYPKAEKLKGEEQLEGAKMAANVGEVKNWIFYEENSV